MEITVQGTQYSLLFVLRHNQYRCTGAACVWRRLNEKGLLIMRSQLQAMAPGLRLVVVLFSSDKIYLGVTGTKSKQSKATQAKQATQSKQQTPELQGGIQIFRPDRTDPTK